MGLFFGDYMLFRLSSLTSAKIQLCPVAEATLEGVGW
jgi:hypothetical protein